MDHQYFMRLAIDEALKAREIGEVPIGAIVVKDGGVIGRGHNRREIDQDPTAHAEVLAIKDAARNTGSWRLEDSVIYVTIEPCPMCAGAMVLARVKTLVFGAPDPKAGAAGTLMNVVDDERLNHRMQIVSGVLEEECSRIISDFFRRLRK